MQRSPLLISTISKIVFQPLADDLSCPSNPKVNLILQQEKSASRLDNLLTD